LQQAGPFPPIVTLLESEEGLLELSFALHDQKGRILAEMQNNLFRASPPKLFDIHVDTGGTKIKIKVSRSDVILNLWSTRVTLDQLEGWAQEDWDQWRSHRDRRARENPVFRTWQEVYLPDDTLHPYGRFLGGAGFFSPTAVLPSESQSEEYRRITFEGIRNYANTYLIDDEGKVPVLDYRNLVTYLGNRKLQVRNGIDWGGVGWFWLSNRP
jgi:hypothetical protein